MRKYQTGHIFSKTPNISYVYEVGPHICPSGTKQRQALFNCNWNLPDCKLKFISRIIHAKSGHTQSCGCYNKKRISEFNGIEPGYKFPGTYCVAIEEVESRTTPGGTKRRRFKVECTYDGPKCRKVFETSLISLSEGDEREPSTKSCGCLQKASAHEAKFVDRTGQRFGYLLVKRLDHIKEGGQAYWECLCDCGATPVVAGGALQSENTVSCGCINNLGQTYVYREVVNPLCPDAVMEYRLNNGQRIDIAVPSLKCAIEYDGRQHYEMWDFDKGDKSLLLQRQFMDRKKEKELDWMGWALLRVPDQAFRRDPEQWKLKIENFIKTARATFNF